MMKFGFDDAALEAAKAEGREAQIVSSCLKTCFQRSQNQDTTLLP